MRTTAAPAPSAMTSTQSAALPIVLALCFTHFLNDMTQALLPAIYPIIKQAYSLDFGQIGLLTLAFQFTASLLQPVVGLVTDRHPQPYSLAAGMASSLVGLLMLATASHYWVLFVGAMLIGMGSAIFHPEATRMARFASGGRHGFTQSL
ncbi:MAG: MFS transporter, partial [Proteobacteria bacterium]|nr:MFS transporter [Pseudomonadota bacterium]